jgi:hypothetical protein
MLFSANIIFLFLYFLLLRHSYHYPNLKHFRCNDLSQDDIKEIRKSFFSIKNKNVQDNKLGNFMAVEKPVTSRSRNRKPEGKSHDLTAKYHVSFIILIHIG